MEFHQKLQELRKQRGLTQEELAQILSVSRAAVSKWESGRGYPNLDSLKDIAKYFSVTIDCLLSGEQVLSIAEADTREKENRTRDLVFGLLDCSAVLLLFLPFFGMQTGGKVSNVSLLDLSGIAPWLNSAFFGVAAGSVILGLCMLALHNCPQGIWKGQKHMISLIWSGAGAFLFIISRQAYAAAFFFLFLIIKVGMLIKRG